MELYIHIPFCVRKCAYCDFLSGPASAEVKERYVRTLLKEIELSGQSMTERNPVTSIFIGGGTPSLLPGEWISSILSSCRDNFLISDHAEITMEANPGTVTEQSLKAYRQAGVNRLSFGLQSADNAELKRIGRIHTWEMFLDSFHMAGDAGFSNINVDVISGLPGQTVESCRHTLEKVTALNPEHVSVYSLILEEGTALYREAASGRMMLPEEEATYRMDVLTREYLEACGFHRYEISNYAREGYECRHNIGYWTGVPYLGFGLGAAGYTGQMRYSNEKNMNAYLAAEGNPDRIRSGRTELSKEDRMEEFMFLGLRMCRGVSAEEFKKRFGISFDEVYGPVAEKQMQEGLLVKAEDSIRLTVRGMEVANRVMAEYLF